jgi:hypothetical protein
MPTRKAQPVKTAQMVKLDNGATQARRAQDVQHGTRAQSRRCLKPPLLTAFSFGTPQWWICIRNRFLLGFGSVGLDLSIHQAHEKIIELIEPFVLRVVKYLNATTASGAVGLTQMA